VLLALDWLLGLATLGAWILTVLFSRYSSLGALFAAAAAPILAAMMWGANFQMLAVGVMSLGLIAKHWGNLQRLLAGTEPRIGAKKKVKT
jgi:glycerol-3-phosphate acyltransferase PlsY